MVILPVDQGFEHGSARSFARTQPHTIRFIITNSPSTRV
jgi:DhnA family fructose-bisphosphate aldolase class Ia